MSTAGRNLIKARLDEVGGNFNGSKSTARTHSCATRATATIRSWRRFVSIWRWRCSTEN